MLYQVGPPVPYFLGGVLSLLAVGPSLRLLRPPHGTALAAPAPSIVEPV
ncbi:MAG: hypothetical protein U0470_10645 [Anaerolineae bacterium]